MSGCWLPAGEQIRGSSRALHRRRQKGWQWANSSETMRAQRPAAAGQAASPGYACSGRAPGGVQPVLKHVVCIGAVVSKRAAALLHRRRTQGGGAPASGGRPLAAHRVAALPCCCRRGPPGCRCSKFVGFKGWGWRLGCTSHCVGCLCSLQYGVVRRRSAVAPAPTAACCPAAPCRPFPALPSFTECPQGTELAFFIEGQAMPV